MLISCPSCKAQIPKPPDKWAGCDPWQCSHCEKLFCMDDFGPFAIPDDLKPLSPLLGYDVARRWLFYCGRQNYYSYALCRSNSVPFYVGSGRHERALSHVPEAYRTPSDRLSPKHREILRLEKIGDTVMYHFLGLFATRVEATVLENFYIHHWGRRSTGGILTNISGETKVEYDLPLSHVGFPEEPEVVNHPDAIGKYKQSIRVFHHSDIIVPPPTSGAIVTGAVMSCPACGVKGQYMRAMDDKKLLCSNCAHYFMDGQPEDGKRRMYGDYNTLKRY